MKTKFLLFIILLCLGVSSLFAQGEETRDPSDGIITVGDYCAFLNAVAATAPLASSLKLKVEVEAINSNDLYDERMQGGSILRTGLPGSYCYDLISNASTDSFSSCIAGLSWNDAIQYCEWRDHSASTFNLNSCAIGAAHVDPELKSNRFTFCIASSEANAHQAVGEEVASGVIDQIVDAIFTIGVVASPTAMRGEERRSNDLILRLNPSPTLDLTLSEDAEQVRMGKFFTQAVSGKAPNYYEKSDALLPESERAWEARATARQHLQSKEEALERAQAKFNEEEELLANKNIEKTTLGRIANAAGKASSITSPLSVPLVSLSGIFDGASALADIANRRIEKHSFKKAKAVLDKAIEEVATAHQYFDQLERAAFAFDVRRKEPEQQAREVQQQDTFKEAIKLKPPVQSNQASDWQKWAEELMRGTTTSRSEIAAFTQKAKSHPTWAAHKAARAWVERMSSFEQNLKTIEQQQKNECDLLEAPYGLAQEQAQEARATATAAYERRERMIQTESDAHEEYNALRELLRQQEAQRPKTATLLQTIEFTKNASGNAYASWQQAEKELQAHGPVNRQLLEETEQIALGAENQALELFQQKEQLEKRYVRKIERAKAQLQADQHAWREVWPEEVLHQKLQQENGKIAFATAVRCKNKAAWRNAEHEAEEMETLWGRMKNLEQQKLWKERANRAAIKRTFLGIQELWGSFSDAVQTLVENPNFDPDFKNSQNLTSRGEEIAHATEQAALLIDETLFSAVGAEVNLLSRAVRNVVHVAKMTANKSKPITETTWRDVVKETNMKALKIAETAPLLWQEEATWMAQAIQEAGTFAKSIVEPQQRSIDNTLFHPTELKELGEMVAQIKNIYQKEIRYMRARRNFLGRALEPQKKALLERKKSFYKRDRRWKGERGLLDARKKLAPQWKKRSLQNKKLSFQDYPGRENIPAAPAEVEESSEGTVTTSEASSPYAMATEESNVDPSQDILAQEGRLAEERATLDQEKKVIDQKEEELRERESKLEENAKAMDQKSAILAAETIGIAKEKARLAQEQKQTEENSEELAKKIATLQAEEARILQEREALAKEAESLEVLASTELDQKMWNLLFGRIHRAIEQEKRAVLEAQNVEGTREVIYWLEAHNAAYTAQQLWEEMTQSMDGQIREAKSPLEKNRLALEKNNAQKEKESWKHKAAEYLAKVDAVKEKVEKQHLEKQAALQTEEKRLLQEREQLSQQKEVVLAFVPSSDPWELVAEKMGKVATLEESISNLELHEVETAWKQAHHEAVEIVKLLEELINSFDQKKNAATKGLEKKRLDSELATAHSEYEEWKGKVDSYLQQVENHLQQQKRLAYDKKLAELRDKRAKMQEQQQEALKKGDRAAAKRYELAAKVLGSYSNSFFRNDPDSGATWAYEQAVEQQAKNNGKAAEAYRKCARAYEQQAEALARGDQAGAALEEKIAETQNSTADAYKNAAEAQARGNHEAKEAYRKSAHTFEQQTEALARRDQAGAAFQKKIAKAQGGAANAYSAAVESQTKGYDQAAEAYRKSAQTREQQVKALVRGDHAGAELQDEIARVQGCAACAYKDAAEAQANGYDQVAKAYRKCVQTREQQAEALAKGDQAGAALQGKVAGVQIFAAWTYKNAAETQARGNHEASEAYRKMAHAYEQKAEALARGDQAGAELQDKIAGSQGAAARAYSNVAEAQARGNHEEDGYRKCAQAHEQQAEALARGDQAGAALQEKVAKAQRNAAWAYGKAAEVQTKEDDQTAEAYRKCAQSYEQEAKALARSAEALTRGNQTEAALQEKMAKAQESAAWAYGKAVEVQTKGDDQTAEAYRKGAQAHEQEAKALARSAEALIRGNQTEAALQEKMAKAQESAAWAYEKAVEVQTKGDDKTVEACRKCAQACEQQAEALARSAEALTQKDQAGAALQKKIAEAQESAAWAYGKAVEVQTKGDDQTAEAYRKCAQAYEQEAKALARSAEALAQKDQAGAELQRKIAEAQESAAWAYKNAAKAQTQSDDQTAEAYCKEAYAYEKEAEALAGGDQVGAALQKKITEAQMHAAWAYSAAAEGRAKGYDKAAEAHRKCAQTWEQQAEALARGDQEAAEYFKKETEGKAAARR